MSAKLPANQLKATKRTTPGQERKQVFDVCPLVNNKDNAKLCRTHFVYATKQSETKKKQGKCLARTGKANASIEPTENVHRSLQIYTAPTLAASLKFDGADEHVWTRQFYFTCTRLG